MVVESLFDRPLGNTTAWVTVVRLCRCRLLLFGIRSSGSWSGSSCGGGRGAIAGWAGLVLDFGCGIRGCWIGRRWWCRGLELVSTAGTRRILLDDRWRLLRERRTAINKRVKTVGRMRRGRCSKRRFGRILVQFVRSVGQSGSTSARARIDKQVRRRRVVRSGWSGSLFGSRRHDGSSSQLGVQLAGARASRAGSGVRRIQWTGLEWKDLGIWVSMDGGRQSPSARYPTGIVPSAVRTDKSVAWVVGGAAAPPMSDRRCRAVWSRQAARPAGSAPARTCITLHQISNKDKHTHNEQTQPPSSVTTEAAHCLRAKVM